MQWNSLQGHGFIISLSFSCCVPRWSLTDLGSSDWSRGKHPQTTCYVIRARRPESAAAVIMAAYRSAAGFQRVLHTVKVSV